MPFIKVYIHFVWSTKNRIAQLTSPDIRQELWYHIKENALKKKIFIDTINGYHDHCHCTVSLRAQQSLSYIMKMIKGESSCWINKSKLCKQRFEWQDEYYAVSVSPDDIDRVRAYIKNQAAHHRHQTFREEVDIFLREWGFQRFKDGSVGPSDLFL